MSNIFTTTIRFNLDRAEDREALSWLQMANKSEYRSYSRAVIAAVNDHFGRKARLKDDPFLETRAKEDAFLKRVLDTVERGMQSSAVNSLTGLVALLHGGTVTVPPPTPITENAEAENDLDTALDFIDGM